MVVLAVEVVEAGAAAVEVAVEAAVTVVVVTVAGKGTGAVALLMKSFRRGRSFFLEVLVLSQGSFSGVIIGYVRIERMCQVIHGSVWQARARAKQHSRATFFYDHRGIG